MTLRGKVGLVVGGLLVCALVASVAVAQTAPWRVVQASDGTLYVLKDGARYAIVGDAIDDDELGAYADGGPVGAALLLNGLAAPAPVTAAAPLAAAREEAAPAEAAPGPAAEAVVVPGSAKGSATGAGAQRTQTATTAQFISVRGGAPGQTASVSVQTQPGMSCALSYSTPAATRSGAAGLESRTADNSGVVTWSFLIGSNTQPGNGTVTATCGGVRISSPIQIGDAGVTR